MKVNSFNVQWNHLVPQTGFITENKTICTISVDDTIISEGIAKCGTNDQFSYNIGRRVSLARALRNSEMFSEKRIRRQFWESYRTMTKTPRWGDNTVIVDDVILETSNV